VIPRQIDDYLGFLKRFPQQAAKEQLDNPVWHIHAGHPPAPEDGLPFNILLNLVGVANTEDRAVLWGFIARYHPGATPATHPYLDKLVGHAIAYWRRFIKPARRFRLPSEQERAALQDLIGTLEPFRGIDPAALDSEKIQHEVYEVGKRHGFASDLRAWFKALYEILLGTAEGPRMGSFIAIYGVAETIALIERVLAGDDLGQAA
jgi:lysyl-tRNA synthetase class 1